MKKYLLGLVVLLLGFQVTAVFAADREALLMVRSDKPFKATLDQLSAAINFNDYKISRIQRVDIGLTKTGYKTEKYRVVFFARAKELDRLAASNPKLIPFMPMKVVIFSEGKDTIMLAVNPNQLRKLVPEKKLFPYFDRWESDLKKILESAKE